MTQLGCMGRARCLSPQHDAQRRRSQRQGRESEEGDSRAAANELDSTTPHESAIRKRFPSA